MQCLTQSSPTRRSSDFDHTITSTSSADQLAIEFKHGSKGLSLVDLRAALKDQLAGKYLLPAVRRHGILFISHHKDARFWRDKAQRRTARFPEDRKSTRLNSSH